MSKALGESWCPRSRQSLDELLVEATTRFSLSPDQIRSASRERHLAAARAWIAHEAVRLGIATICEVARHLRRHEASIRGLMRRHPGE